MLTGKPDAGNPPVRFGGRGGNYNPLLPQSGRMIGPISKCTAGTPKDRRCACGTGGMKTTAGSSPKRKG